MELEMEINNSGFDAKMTLADAKMDRIFIITNNISALPLLISLVNYLKSDIKEIIYNVICHTCHWTIHSCVCVCLTILHDTAIYKYHKIVMSLKYHQYHNTIAKIAMVLDILWRNLYNELFFSS